jgi:hypothetical protein
MTIRTHTFAGQRYAVRSQAGLRAPDLAECDFTNRVIRIPIDGDTREELDQIIHEGMHAACPYLSEDAINGASTSIARLMWRLGWRKDDG